VVVVLVVLVFHGVITIWPLPPPISKPSFLTRLLMVGGVGFLAHTATVHTFLSGELFCSVSASSFSASER
jgi:hypothetical protein